MGRPKKTEYSLKERILKIKQAGLSLPVREKEVVQGYQEYQQPMGSLRERIEQILKLIKTQPVKATDMVYLVMYDIEDNKVRTLIAKYLLEKGCIRIQKSVYMAKTDGKVYREVKQALKEIQECYENSDSILLVPVPVNTPGSMEIIGKDIQIDLLIDKPNTLFF